MNTENNHKNSDIHQLETKLFQQVEKCQHAEKIQRVLFSIAELASNAEDIPIFFHRTHQIMSELFCTDNFYIALLDDKEENLVFNYFSDIKDNKSMIGESLSLSNNTLSTYLFRSDKLLLINQSEFKEIILNHNVINNGAIFTSWLGVPLRAKNKSIGVMVVQSYSDNAIYETWHCELLEYISHQVAMTITSKKYSTELQKKILERTLTLENEIENRKKSQETQSALYFIANLANMDLDLESFYHELHLIISRIVYCENFFIGLKNESEESISIVYYVDTKDNWDVKKISTIPIEKLKKSLTVHVMNSGRTLLANMEQIQEITKNNNLDLFGEETVSWLGIPLTMNGSVIGILVLQSYLQDKILTEEDRELMIFVGQHVATALQRHKSKHYLKIQVEERTNELNKSNLLLIKQIEETEHSKKLQIALYQIAELASSKESTDHLYQQFHQIISQLIYANNFFIALYDDNKEKLEFVYFVDTKDYLNSESIKKIPAESLKNTLTGYVLKSGHSYLKTPNNKEQQKKIGIVTIGKEACYWLGVPLKIDNIIIGIIVIQSYEITIEINEWQRELLEFVSHHIAITLERKNARKALEKKVDERTLELAITNKDLLNQILERKRSESIQSALYKISNLANKNIPLKKLLEKCHHIIASLIYAENFYIALWNQENDDMDWSYFIDSESHQYTEPIEKSDTEFKKKSFARYLVKSSQPILLNKQGMNEMAASGKVNIIGPVAEYLLGVPLIGSNGSIGAMVVQSYNKNIQYNSADQEFLNFVAQSIVTTIEKREYNLNLEKQVERRTEELTVSNEQLQREISQRQESEILQSALFKISETPQQCTTQKELYSRLHEIISQLMYVENFYIALVDLENECFNLDYVSDRVDLDIPETIPMKKTLTGYVYRQGKTIHINNENIRQLEKDGEFVHLGTYSVDWLGVPLISGGLIYGIMILQSYDSNHVYGDREVGIINFVSTHIAEALQRKNAEKKLEIAYAELANKTQKAEAASKAKSSFLATVSHEIRTPMNGILGLLSLMSDTEMNRIQRDYVSKISSSANSLLGIINDILDFSKIEQGKLELEDINFSLLDLLDNLVDLFSSRLNEKKLKFLINIEPNVNLFRIGDPLRLSQILINLLGNAVKFTSHGFINIHLSQKHLSKNKSDLIFSIEDSGIGIADAQRLKIFETFTQADDTTTRKFGGSGLGLSICKQLISMMQGSINVEGQLGVGSRFIFNVKLKTQKDFTYPLDTTGVNLLLVSDDLDQVNSWKNFCTIFKLTLNIMSSKDLLNTQNKAKKISDNITHIFIDESTRSNDLNIELLNIIQTSIKFTTPCFLLITPNQKIKPELGKYTQFVYKPIKMGIILSLIKDDYDIFQIEQIKKLQHITTRPKLFNLEILLAEDNPINQQVAKEMLVKAGAIITLVENGQLAVEACKQKHYDLVLMDMQMPVMDGYQASELIRKIYTSDQLPIIAMTANVMKGDKEKCLNFGMNDYIGKPINREHLLDTLELYINKENEIVPAKKLSVISTIPSQNYDLFDVQKLADKFDNLQLANELIDLFYDTHKNDSTLIANLLSSDHIDEAKRIFHKLKGSCGELDLFSLHQLSAEIEAQLKQNEVPKITQLESFYFQLDNIINHFSHLKNTN